MSSTADPPSLAPPAEPAPAFDLEKRVGQYVALRDKIAEIKKRHTAELAPYHRGMEVLNDMLLQHLLSTNSQNAKAKSGTAFKQERVSVTISDAQVFREYVIENEAWDLIDWRANKVSVSEAVDEYNKDVAEAVMHNQPPPNSGGLPPGLKFTREYVAGVQRS